jgi:pimeloyl-ACP methyl ester carboxylesterase
VVLIHGVGLNKEMWGRSLAWPTTTASSPTTCSATAPAAPAADTPLEGYADQLAELLDHLQIAQATVIGFSMGGLVARAFALHYPQRLAAWWCSTACSTAPPSRAPG